MCSLCYEHVSRRADTNVNQHANAVITSDYVTGNGVKLVNTHSMFGPLWGCIVHWFFIFQWSTAFWTQSSRCENTLLTCALKNVCIEYRSIWFGTQGQSRCLTNFCVNASNFPTETIFNFTTFELWSLPQLIIKNATCILFSIGIIYPAGQLVLAHTNSCIKAFGNSGSWIAISNVSKLRIVA